MSDLDETTQSPTQGVGEPGPESVGQPGGAPFWPPPPGWHADSESTQAPGPGADFADGEAPAAEREPDSASTPASDKPAGWYADPLGVGAERYWDGTGWSERVQGAPEPEPNLGAIGGTGTGVAPAALPDHASGRGVKPPQAQQLYDLKSLGLTRTLSLSEVSYYGGWSRHPSPEGKSNLILKIDKSGISLRKFKEIFTIPWEDVADITVEGPQEAEKRFTATRLIALGPLGLAFKKSKKGSKEAIITLTTVSGDQAVFHVAKKLPREIQPKLVPLALQIRTRVAAVREPTPPVAEPTPHNEAAAPDIAEQIEKLAALKEKGILTEDEYAAKKAELLARM